MGKSFVMELKVTITCFKLCMLSWVICRVQALRAEWGVEEFITETGKKEEGRKDLHKTVSTR